MGVCGGIGLEEGGVVCDGKGMEGFDCLLSLVAGEWEIAA